MEMHEAYNNYRIEVPVEFAEAFSHFYFAENKSMDAISRTLLPSIAKYWFRVIAYGRGKQTVTSVLVSRVIQ